MAALRQLLNRGLLAGRRAAIAPPRAPRPFSTAGGSSHVPQYRQPPDRSSYLRIIENAQGIWEHVEAVRWVRHKYLGRLTAGVLVLIGSNCLSGHVAPYLPRSSKSPSQEIE